MKLDRSQSTAPPVERIPATASGAAPSPGIRDRTSRAIASGRGVRHYSRFVRLMKLLLPSVAVVVLGVVLAWPQIRSQAERLAGELASLDPRAANTRTLVNARFHGVDADNQPYTLFASKAIEQADNPDQIDLWDPEGDIALDTGRWLALRGNTGVYSKGDRTLYLDGDVVLYRDDGFEFHTETAHIDLKTKDANGADPVQGSGPDGTIESTGFDIVEGGRVVVFTGQAHLVLTEGGEIAP
jgi:lipopolysaccharide export system protein LptC